MLNKDSGRSVFSPVGGGMLLLVIAGLMRFVGLGALDPWGDEVYTYINSTDLIPKLLRWETLTHNLHSPLPFIDVKIARQVLGDSDWSLRFPMALYGTAAVIGLYVVIGRMAGWSVGFFSGLWLALNPFALEWSREARMYSHWLFYTVMLMGLAWSGVRHAQREEGGSWVDWRWWLLGMLFMMVHASAIFGVMTIGGIGVWLGIVGLVSLRDRVRTGLTILGGAGLSGAVYLGSWGLCGVGKVLVNLGTDPGADPHFEPPPPFGVVAENLVRVIGGYVPLGWSIVLWSLALIGVVWLGVSGKWRVGLLVGMVTLFPMLSYPSVSSRHFFTERYVFVGLVGLSVGLGVLCERGWWGRDGSVRVGTRVAVVLGLLVSCAFWVPGWRNIYFVPKTQVRAAMEPIREHATEEEVVVVVPDWAASLESYPGYSMGDRVRRIRPPIKARFAVLEADRIPGGSMEPFVDEFENLYGDEVDPAVRPPGAWVFVELENTIKDKDQNNIPDRIDLIHELLAAYGLTGKDLQPYVQPKSILVARLTPGKVDHVLTVPGRRKPGT